jgi:DNA-binding CsgD family transcriptional regulator
MAGGPKPIFPTPAEKQVLELLIFGKTNSEIAQVLGKAIPTVKGQVGMIIQKLHAENRTQAVAKYLRPDLFDKKE